MLKAMPYSPARSRTKTKRLAEERFFRLIHDLSHESDETLSDDIRRVVPDAWHLIEMDVDVAEPKTKVTLYLDQPVARLFRAMGAGYQARINRILATWAQMKMVELKAAETSIIDALQMTRAEKNAPDPEPWHERRRERLEEHWAYLQGREDAGG